MLQENPWLFSKVSLQIRNKKRFIFEHRENFLKHIANQNFKTQIILDGIELLQTALCRLSKI